MIARECARRIGTRQIENANLQRHLVGGFWRTRFDVARQPLGDNLGLGTPLFAHELIESIFELRVQSDGQPYGEGVPVDRVVPILRLADTDAPRITCM